jgi:hypothetical protein
VIVIITDKHWLLPWRVVERQLRGWFGSSSLPGDLAPGSRKRGGSCV